MSSWLTVLKAMAMAMHTVPDPAFSLRPCMRLRSSRATPCIASLRQVVHPG